jgi:hypothetical protein
MSVLSMLFGGAVDNSKTTNETNIVNESITNVVNNVSANCKVVSSNTQVISGNTRNISGVRNSTINNNYLNDLQSKINFSCIQDTSIKAQLKSDISREIDNVISKKTSGFGGKAVFDNSEINNINNLKTTIVNNIDTNTLTECIVIQQNNQSISSNIDIIGDIKDSTINANLENKLISEMVSKCVQSNKAVTEASTKLNEIVKSKTEVVSEGASIPGFGSFMLIIVGVMGVGAYMFKSMIPKYMHIIGIIMTLLVFLYIVK